MIILMASVLQGHDQPVHPVSKLQTETGGIVVTELLPLGGSH